MLETVGPRELLGEDADRVAEAVLKVSLGAHNDFAAAQDAARSRAQRVYGQIWSELPLRLCAELHDDEGSITVRPGRAPYKLPVINNCVLFPWRIPSAQKLDTAPFGLSAARVDVFNLEPPSQYMMQFDGENGFEAGAAPEAVLLRAVAEVAEVAKPRRLNVIVVVMQSNREHLLDLCWGVGAPLPDGTLRLVRPEILYSATSSNELGNVRLPAADSARPEGFAGGSLPDRIVRSRDVSGDA